MMSMDESIDTSVDRIREDAIRIQEGDIQDTLEDIRQENQKSSFILAFLAVFFGSFFDSLPTLSVKEQYVFVAFLVSATFIALWNIIAKKLKTHSNVDEIFVLDDYKNWGIYIKDKHLRLRGVYSEAQRVLRDKSFFNKVAIVIASFSILVLIRSIII